MSNRAASETAAFLDSTPARPLLDAGVDRAGLQRIVGLFLDAAYERLGKAPQHLDGDDIHAILGHELPAHFGPKDPLAAHVVPCLRAYLDFLGERAVVPQAFEQRQSLEATAAVFDEAVRSGQPHVHHRVPQQPFVHHAPKTGRNDPCPCGSGKKFKHCCQRLGK